MVDFRDDPYLGGLLHRLHDGGELISLICHGPIAMASARYRVQADGTVTTPKTNDLAGARLTVLSPVQGDRARGAGARLPQVPR
jgi:putative intracellular protease/amidase